MNKSLSSAKAYRPYRPRPRWRAGLLYHMALLALVLLLPCFAPAPSFAQDDTWLERTTDYFTILYQPGSEADAEAYAGFVDTIYDEMANLFQHRVQTPVTLHLYPTFESYYEVNPTARDMGGIVAHADFRRRSLAVVLPQTEQQTPDEIQNNIRHELTHIIASDLSANQLNTGFQEGIAQYVEIPTAELERKKSLLERALQDNNLINWSLFDDREQVYSSPEMSYPQSLSVVTFLVDTYSFDRFREFLIATAQSSGYRSALEQTYGVSASNLEAQWREWLPSYVDGSYHENAGASYDLAYPRQLLAQGRYAEAQSELEQAIEWLKTTPQQELVTEAESLLAVSRAGQQAEQMATEAREALVAGDYERAARLVGQSRDGFAALGDTHREQVLMVYLARAERGLRANGQLERAAELVRTLRLPEARDSAETAAAEFAVLGDTSRMDQALELRRSVDTMQRLAGLTLVTLGMIGVIVSLWGRWAIREPELW